MAWRWTPSRWLLCACATGALIGISWKLGPPSREQLGVEVGVDPPGEQRVVGEVDARHQVLDAEGDLLGLGEEVVGVAVEHHAADRRHRHQLLRHDLGGIEHVEAERVRLRPR